MYINQGNTSIVWSGKMFFQVVFSSLVVMRRLGSSWLHSVYLNKKSLLISKWKDREKNGGKDKLHYLPGKRATFCRELAMEIINFVVALETEGGTSGPRNVLGNIIHFWLMLIFQWKEGTCNLFSSYLVFLALKATAFKMALYMAFTYLHTTIVISFLWSHNGNLCCGLSL